MSINLDKYQEAILYLCQKLGGKICGKKKLAKLLYFADFDNFEKTGESITRDKYFALPMGPFPTSLDAVTKEMQKGNRLTVKQTEWHGYPTEVYACVLKCPPPKHLTTEEKTMLDRVAKKYGGLTGKQLEDLSHQEAPYIATELQQEISYELTYYRGTDFTEV